jgi:catechol 2,3-dioxygenase-like lactoylglutathione lyase family enzyme
MTLRPTFNRLLVTEFAACYRFYRDVLGFSPTFGAEEDVYADFNTGGIGLALVRRELMAEAVGAADRPAAAECQDRVAFIYEVDDVDQACEELQAKGVTFVAMPQDRPDWGIRTAHFRDPDGNLLEVNAPLRG